MTGISRARLGILKLHLLALESEVWETVKWDRSSWVDNAVFFSRWRKCVMNHLYTTVIIVRQQEQERSDESCAEFIAKLTHFVVSFATLFLLLAISFSFGFSNALFNAPMSRNVVNLATVICIPGIQHSNPKRDLIGTTISRGGSNSLKWQSQGLHFRSPYLDR